MHGCLSPGARAQVYGAVTMNNTLCLGLFLLVMHIRTLPWTYSSEVITTVGAPARLIHHCLNLYRHIANGTSVRVDMSRCALSWHLTGKAQPALVLDLKVPEHWTSTYFGLKDTSADCVATVQLPRPRWEHWDSSRRPSPPSGPSQCCSSTRYPS